MGGSFKKRLGSVHKQNAGTSCGKVRLKLYKGNLRIVGRSSKYSLYDVKLATYEVGTTFDQSFARGFIELWGLQSKTFHILKNNLESKKEARCESTV
jgi:argininosuccinate synthase (EC 6.3.4.5)